MPFANKPTTKTLASLANVSLTPFWLDDKKKPASAPVLTDQISTDLLVIGGGYSGLWTALQAREANPARDVVLIEAGASANAASGRNGGFVAASLTHGFENGKARWPGQMSELTALGHSNLQGIADAVRHYQIECDFMMSGELTVATEPYQVEILRAASVRAEPYGEKLTWMDAGQVQQQVHSPTYLGALFNPIGAMVNPARLAWGLRRACLETGVRIFENTPATGIRDAGNELLTNTPYGSIRARRIALGTNAFQPLIKRLSHYVVPVYDYVLMTEALTASQREAIGWNNRQGIADAANQFHYYRTTADGRILWGGYDAIYYQNNGVGPQFDVSWKSFGKLAEHFFQTFPQLEGLSFTHAWGGAIDTCSRFSPFWGTACAGKLAYSLGFTGLGVGATRFGAQVMLDLLDGVSSQRTSLKMVQTKPMPFPPEPVRSAVINLTRGSLDRADQNLGNRNFWLRTLDAFGLGFDS